MTIEENLINIRKRIASYEQKYGRAQGSVRLLAASKGQAAIKVEAAVHAGQHLFGENYLQEGLKKISALGDHDVEWHFIGPIQSNKTRKIAENFSWVHGIDNLKIASRFNDQRPHHLPPLNICIEVNVSHEASKSGVAIEEALPLAKECLALPHLELRGLMTVPAINKDFDAERREFRKLFQLWETFRDQGIVLDILSMGMSDDFEAAIAEGSTMVRIGRAIFGERERKK